MMDPQIPEIEEEPILLLPCASCSRTFRPEALAKHSKVCEKTLMKKRKQFDSAKQRLQGTEIENFVTQPITKNPRKKEPPLNPSKAKVKEKIDLAKTIQVAKKSVDTPSVQIKPSDHEECPYCGRTFGPKSFERHTEFCKEQHQKLKLTPTVNNEAKERLKVRTSYRGPLTNKVLNRDRYQPAKNRDSSPMTTSLTELRDEGGKTKGLMRNASLRSSLRSRLSDGVAPPPLRRTMTQINPPRSVRGSRDSVNEQDESSSVKRSSTSRPRLYSREPAERKVKSSDINSPQGSQKKNFSTAMNGPSDINDISVNTFKELNVTSAKIEKIGSVKQSSNKTNRSKLPVYQRKKLNLFKSAPVDNKSLKKSEDIFSTCLSEFDSDSTDVFVSEGTESKNKEITYLNNSISCNSLIGNYNNASGNTSVEKYPHQCNHDGNTLWKNESNNSVITLNQSEGQTCNASDTVEDNFYPTSSFSAVDFDNKMVSNTSPEVDNAFNQELNASHESLLDYHTSNYIILCPQKDSQGLKSCSMVHDADIASLTGKSECENELSTIKTKNPYSTFNMSNNFMSSEEPNSELFIDNEEQISNIFNNTTHGDQNHVGSPNNGRCVDHELFFAEINDGNSRESLYYLNEPQLYANNASVSSSCLSSKLSELQITNLSTDVINISLSENAPCYSKNEDYDKHVEIENVDNLIENETNIEIVTSENTEFEELIPNFNLSFLSPENDNQTVTYFPLDEKSNVKSQDIELNNIKIMDKSPLQTNIIHQQKSDFSLTHFKNDIPKKTVEELETQYILGTEANSNASNDAVSCKNSILSIENDHSFHNDFSSSELNGISSFTATSKDFKSELSEFQSNVHENSEGTSETQTECTTSDIVRQPCVGFDSENLKNPYDVFETTINTPPNKLSNDSNSFINEWNVILNTMFDENIHIKDNSIPHNILGNSDHGENLNKLNSSLRDTCENYEPVNDNLVSICIENSVVQKEDCPMKISSLLPLCLHENEPGANHVCKTCNCNNKTSNLLESEEAISVKLLSSDEVTLSLVEHLTCENICSSIKNIENDVNKMEFNSNDILTNSENLLIGTERVEIHPVVHDSLPHIDEGNSHLQNHCNSTNMEILGAFETEILCGVTEVLDTPKMLPLNTDIQSLGERHIVTEIKPILYPLLQVVTSTVGDFSVTAKSENEKLGDFYSYSVLTSFLHLNHSLNYLNLIVGDDKLHSVNKALQKVMLQNFKTNSGKQESFITIKKDKNDAKTNSEFQKHRLTHNSGTSISRPMTAPTKNICSNETKNTLETYNGLKNGFGLCAADQEKLSEKEVIVSNSNELGTLPIISTGGPKFVSQRLLGDECKKVIVLTRSKRKEFINEECQAIESSFDNHENQITQHVDNLVKNSDNLGLELAACNSSINLLNSFSKGENEKCCNLASHKYKNIESSEIPLLTQETICPTKSTPRISRSDSSGVINCRKLKDLCTASVAPEIIDPVNHTTYALTNEKENTDKFGNVPFFPSLATTVYETIGGKNVKTGNNLKFNGEKTILTKNQIAVSNDSYSKYLEDMFPKPKEYTNFMRDTSASLAKENNHSTYGINSDMIHDHTNYFDVLDTISEDSLEIPNIKYYSSGMDNNEAYEYSDLNEPQPPDILFWNDHKPFFKKHHILKQKQDNKLKMPPEIFCKDHIWDEYSQGSDHELGNLYRDSLDGSTASSENKCRYRHHFECKNNAKSSCSPNCEQSKFCLLHSRHDNGFNNYKKSMYSIPEKQKSQRLPPIIVYKKTTKHVEEIYENKNESKRLKKDFIRNKKNKKSMKETEDIGRKFFRGKKPYSSGTDSSWDLSDSSADNMKKKPSILYEQSYESIEYNEKVNDCHTVKTSVYKLPFNIKKEGPTVKFPPINSQKLLLKETDQLKPTLNIRKPSRNEKLPSIRKQIRVFPSVVRHVISSVLPKRFSFHDAEKYNPYLSAERQMMELFGAEDTKPKSTLPEIPHSSPIQSSHSSAFVKYSSPKRASSVESLKCDNKENNNDNSVLIGSPSEEKIDNRKNFSLSNLSLCSVVSIDSIDCNKNSVHSRLLAGNIDEFQRSFSALESKSVRTHGKTKVNLQEMLYGSQSPEQASQSESSNSDAGNLEACEAELLISMLEFEKMLKSSPIPSPKSSPPLCSSSGIGDSHNESTRNNEVIIEKNQRNLNNSIDSAYSSLTRSSGAEGERENKELPKFCHECGSKYPVALAKFCCNCGMRRIAL